MAVIVIFILGFLLGIAIFVSVLLKNDALGTYRKSVVTDYLIEQQAHERHNTQVLLDRYDVIVSHQNTVIKLQNESPTLLAYLHELRVSQRENGVNHISQLKSSNDAAPKYGIKIKDNGDYTLHKSEYNTLLVSENGNYIADVTIEELQEMENKRLLVQEIPKKIWVVLCETCDTYFPSTSATSVTCSDKCRKQKSLNRF